VQEATAGLDRAAPLAPADRLWPRSVRPALPGRSRRSSEAPGAEARNTDSGPR